MADMGGYDANLHEPSVGFEPMPAGDYVAAITNSEKRENKAKTGSYLAFTFTVLEGPLKNRKLFKNYNNKNQNADAVRIAEAELSALCRAVGVMQPPDTCSLHNIPLVISVKLKKNSTTGELENDIKAYKPKSAFSGAPATPAAGDRPAWMAPK